MRKSVNNGYIICYAPDHPKAWSSGYVYEHILVIEKELGRLLSAKEIVHHKDGCRINNDPENLEVMNRSTHAIHHRRIGETMVWLTCGFCNNPFLRGKRNCPNKSNQYKRTFCSRICYHAALRS